MGIMERFWNKVDKQQDGCWLWAGAQTKGYGMFKVWGRMRYSHRFLYEITRGPLPPYKPGGYELDHVVCNKKSCVNPEHLRLVTHKQNIMRGDGACAAHARLTHCKRGHEFTTGHSCGRIRRRCSICKNTTERANYAKNKEERCAKRRAQYPEKKEAHRVYQRAYYAKHYAMQKH